MIGYSKGIGKSLQNLIIKVKFPKAQLTSELYILFSLETNSQPIKTFYVDHEHQDEVEVSL